MNPEEPVPGSTPVTPPVEPVAADATLQPFVNPDVQDLQTPGYQAPEPALPSPGPSLEEQRAMSPVSGEDRNRAFYDRQKPTYNRYADPERNALAAKFAQETAAKNLARRQQEELEARPELHAPSQAPVEVVPATSGETVQAEVESTHETMDVIDILRPVQEAEKVVREAEARLRDAKGLAMANLTANGWTTAKTGAESFREAKEALELLLSERSDSF